MWLQIIFRSFCPIKFINPPWHQKKIRLQKKIKSTADWLEFNSWLVGLQQLFDWSSTADGSKFKFLITQSLALEPRNKKTFIQCYNNIIIILNLFQMCPSAHLSLRVPSFPQQMTSLLKEPFSFSTFNFMNHFLFTVG